MVSTYRPGSPEQPIVLQFNPEQSHATLLAMVDGGQAHLPAILNLPEQGSLRIDVESREPVLLQYEAHRRDKGYILVLFPGATQSNPRVAYTFTVAAIYPHIAGIESDPRFDGFRRNWLRPKMGYWQITRPATRALLCSTCTARWQNTRRPSPVA
jgi:hypothetical protein